MGYYTGTATDHADLLDKIRIHATLEGWTCSYADPYHRFEKDGLIVNVASNNTGSGYYHNNLSIETTGGSYNLGVSPVRNVVQTSWLYSDPIISYHAFIDAGSTPSVYIAAEILPNIWRHVQFGIQEKISPASWEGGSFLFGTYTPDVDDWDDLTNGCLGRYVYSASYPHRDGIANYTDDNNDLVWAIYHTLGAYAAGTQTVRYFTTTGYNITVASAGNVVTDASNRLLGLQPNSSTGERLLLPVEVFVKRPEDKHSRCGTLPAVRLCCMEGIQPATEVIIDTETWILFPQRAKGRVASNGLTEESGEFGYAYLKA